MRLAVLSWLLFVSCANAQESSDELPLNVILIMSDDVGVEAFGSYGGETYATPHLDALAAGGMQFSHCYAQPLCTPSRVKLMTGRSNLRNYITFSILDKSERTFAHVARDAGYATAVAGKWQLYGDERYGHLKGKGATPAEAGFDEWCLWQYKVHGSRYWNPSIDVNGVITRGIEDVFGPDLYCDYLLEFAAKHKESPFLAYFPMALVHSPFVRTPHSEPLVEGEETDIQQNFADMMEYMDTIIGRMVSGLEELGLRERTLIIFTSDNGTAKQITSTMNGRVVVGAKAQPSNAGTHVPLIASCPGRVPAGSTCDDLVDLSDFLPTLAELMGAELPAKPVIDGRSFLPQIWGERGDPREYVTIYSNPRPESPKRNPRAFFARDKRYKLYDDGQLFDCLLDPDEQAPIDDEELTEEAKAARELLQGALDSAPPEPPRLKPRD